LVETWGGNKKVTVHAAQGRGTTPFTTEGSVDSGGHHCRSVCTPRKMDESKLAKTTKSTRRPGAKTF